MLADQLAAMHGTLRGTDNTMPFPLIFRATHEAIVKRILVENATLCDTIQSQDRTINSRNLKIMELEALLVAEKCNKYTPAPLESPKKKQTSPLASISRGGWRERARLEAESTLPPVSDSMKNLEEKVKREGGK